MTGSYEDDGTYTLQPTCVFGTDVPNASTMHTLDFSWRAFKWSTRAAYSHTESQKIECKIKLTRDEPAYQTNTCA